MGRMGFLPTWLWMTWNIGALAITSLLLDAQPPDAPPPPSSFLFILGSKLRMNAKK